MERFISNANRRDLVPTPGHYEFRQTNLFRTKFDIWESSN